MRHVALLAVLLALGAAAQLEGSEHVATEHYVDVDADDLAPVLHGHAMVALQRIESTAPSLDEAGRRESDQPQAT